MFRRLLQYDILRKKDFYDREKYPDILSDPKSWLGKIIRIFIRFCVFIAVWVIILETMQGIGPKYQLEFFAIDAVISLIFAAEYLYRYVKSTGKKEFVLKGMNIIDLLSFAPFFIGLIFTSAAGLDILKILRVLRTLRLFEVSTSSPIALWFIKTIHEYQKEYRAILWIFLSVLIIVSSFVYYSEYRVNPDFSSIPQALWWGIVTMTTVWYGDMTPITFIWKFLWVILILLWPVLLAVISSITILVFMDVAESQKITHSKICRTCNTRNGEHANFCFNCWEQHFTDVDHTEEKKWKLSFLNKLFSKK